MAPSRVTRVSSVRRAMARVVKGWGSEGSVREEVGVEMVWWSMEPAVERAKRESWDRRSWRERVDLALPMVMAMGYKGRIKMRGRR